MGLFFIDDNLKNVLELLKKSKSYELKYFSNMIDEYDESGCFKFAQKISHGNIYEGKLDDKKICGGDVGLVSIAGTKDLYSISICDKQNPINNYSFRYQPDGRVGSMIIESERLLKRIKFSVKKGLFGDKITDIKVEIEHVLEPENY